MNIFPLLSTPLGPCTQSAGSVTDRIWNLPPNPEKPSRPRPNVLRVADVVIFCGVGVWSSVEAAFDGTGDLCAQVFCGWIWAFDCRVFWLVWELGLGGAVGMECCVIC